MAGSKSASKLSPVHPWGVRWAVRMAVDRPILTFSCEALRDTCAASAAAVLADFSAVVLQKAADAFQMQLSGPLILLTSAGVHTSAQHSFVTSYLGEKGADLKPHSRYGFLSGARCISACPGV